MNKKQQQQALARRVVFVGYQICGATDRPLRNYRSGKIYPSCLKREQQKECPNWTPGRSQQ